MPGLGSARGRLIMLRYAIGSNLRVCLLWLTGVESSISVCNLMSTLKKTFKVQAGNELSNILQQSSHARKKPPPCWIITKNLGGKKSGAEYSFWWGKKGKEKRTELGPILRVMLFLQLVHFCGSVLHFGIPTGCWRLMSFPNHSAVTSTQVSLQHVAFSIMCISFVPKLSACHLLFWFINDSHP